MVEGWHHEDYFVLCENQDESEQMTDRYGLGTFLPGHTFIGLKGWDDFILTDAAGKLHIVPTVPLTAKKLPPFAWDITLTMLCADDRFTNKIRWYIQPILFGGDPNAGENMTWVTLDQHIDLVKWWNAKYQELQ